jgi:hypothetical protein
MKVYKTCCQNCLFTKDRLVSGKVAGQIIKDCIKNQSYFVCHKATLQGKDIVCANFYSQMSKYSQAIRMAERLGILEFVEQNDGEKLQPYNH